MNSIQRNTWALVADGAQARLFRLGPRAGDIEELQKLRSVSGSTPSRNLVSDASSRSRNVAGFPGGHTKEPRVDAHDQAAIRFARKLMERIERAARDGRFDQLVIAADPRTLGTLRKCMPAGVSERVSREINSDLAWLPEGEIDQRIRAAFALR